MTNEYHHCTMKFKFWSIWTKFWCTIALSTNGLLGTVIINYDILAKLRRQLKLAKYLAPCNKHLQVRYSLEKYCTLHGHISHDTSTQVLIGLRNFSKAILFSDKWISSLYNEVQVLEYLDQILVHNSIINKWALGTVIINYNILAKLRRHASWIHFAKIHFGMSI